MDDEKEWIKSRQTVSGIRIPADMAPPLISAVTKSRRIRARLDGLRPAAMITAYTEPVKRTSNLC